MSKSSMRLTTYKKIEYVDYKHLDDISSNDWIIVVLRNKYGYKIPIEQLFKLKNLNQSYT